MNDSPQYSYLHDSDLQLYHFFFKTKQNSTAMNDSPQYTHLHDSDFAILCIGNLTAGEDVTGSRGKGAQGMVSLTGC